MSRLHQGKHSFDKRYEICFEKDTKPVNGKIPRKNFTEEIFYAKSHGGKSIHEIVERINPVQEHPNDNKRPIFLQFLNCFRKEDFIEPECRSIPHFIKMILIEFLEQKAISDLCEDIVNYCKYYEDARTNHCEGWRTLLSPHSYAYKVLDSLNLREMRNKWIDDGLDLLLNKPLYPNSQLSFSNVSSFCILFLYSECFAYGVEQYLLDSVNGIVAPSEYFDSIDFPQNIYSSESSYRVSNAFRICVKREYRRIRNLILFAEKYMSKDSYKDRMLLVKTEAFLNAYLGFDIRKSRKYAIEDNISRTISQLLAEKCRHADLEARTLWRSIEQLYQENKYNSILTVGYKLYTICVENENILQSSLSRTQKQALIKLKKIYASSDLWSNVDDSEDELSAERIFSELELFYGESRFADAYVCYGYFETCCISMYCILKNKLETAVCSSCGRVYIPKRMPDGEKMSEICCWYEHPIKRQYTCYRNRSVNHGPFVGSVDFQSFFIRYDSIYKCLEELNFYSPGASKENRIEEFRLYINSSLTEIYDHAKQLDRNQQLKFPCDQKGTDSTTIVLLLDFFSDLLNFLNEIQEYRTQHSIWLPDEMRNRLYQYRATFQNTKYWEFDGLKTLV